MRSTRLAALAVVAGGGLLGASATGVATLAANLPVADPAVPELRTHEFADHAGHGHGDGGEHGHDGDHGRL